MLSSAKIGRSSWRYYQRTVAGGACEYYTERGDAPGRWHGHGLTALGLNPGAEVAERELEALFGRAMSPTSGQQLGAAWGERSVTGYDLTFSAPKSVSTLWALGDERWVAQIEIAHAAAVHAALDYLQGVASWSRRGRNGIDQVPSAGYAAALFDHGTSRTGDPQLHTHALVVNKVQCADGAWRTLDGHEIYHHKKAAGAIYQAALRAELQARLPVSFGEVSVHGQAEITGVPVELMRAWSSRTTAVLADAVPTIEQAEQALDRPVTAAERARIIKTAVLATRPPKEHHAADPDRKTTWADQAAALGWTRQQLTRTVAEATTPVSVPVIADGIALTGPLGRRELLAEAVTTLGRTKAVWSRADLTVTIAARVDRLDEPLPSSALAMTRLITDLTDTALGHESTVPNQVAAVGVVPLGVEAFGDTTRASDPRYASRELMDTEARIITHTLRGLRPTPMAPPAAMTRTRAADDTAMTPTVPGLSADQRDAVAALLASRDWVSVMTAPAGSGKTTTIAAAVHAWTTRGVEVTLLAPSARAAAELTAATTGLGLRGETVARWLLTQDNPDQLNRAGLARVRTRPSVVLVDEASMLNTHDLDQLLAHAHVSGSPLVLVGDPAQIGAVNAPGGMFAHLIELLAERRVELSELHRFSQPWEADASLWLRRGDPQALRPYLVHDRIHPEGDGHDAADAVFDRWQQAVEAGADALMLAQSWTDVNALNARARAAAIATGTVHGPVLAIVPTCSRSTRGHTEQRSWRAGDRLLAKHNAAHIRLGRRTLRNGDRLRVLGADRDGLRVECLDDGATTVLPTDYLARHAEYGWASTIDGAQGATTDVSILLARTGLDREHLYVAMTRGRLENHVHTTRELDTGDAGPHRPSRPADPSRDRRDQAATDHAAAIDLLARALATPGVGDAAQSLLNRNRFSSEPVPGHQDPLPRRRYRLSSARRRDDTRVLSI